MARKKTDIVGPTKAPEYRRVMRMGTTLALTVGGFIPDDWKLVQIECIELTPDQATLIIRKVQ